MPMLEGLSAANRAIVYEIRDVSVKKLSQKRHCQRESRQASGIHWSTFRLYLKKWQWHGFDCEGAKNRLFSILKEN